MSLNWKTTWNGHLIEASSKTTNGLVLPLLTTLLGDDEYSLLVDGRLVIKSEQSKLAGLFGKRSVLSGRFSGRDGKTHDIVAEFPRTTPYCLFKIDNESPIRAPALQRGVST